MLGADPDRLAHIGLEVLAVVDDLHGPAPEHVGRTHEHRIADAFGDALGFLVGAGRLAGRLLQAEVGEQLGEALAVLRAVDGIRRGAEYGHARPLQGDDELQGSLAAELHDDAARPLALDDVHDILEGQRLEVEAVGGVVVGGDRLGIAVDHDRLHPRFLEGEGGVHAGVVELDALADPVGPRAEDHDLVARGGRRLVFLFVGRVEVGRVRLEFGRAGVHHLEGGADPRLEPQGPDFRFRLSAELRDPPVGEAHLFGLPERLRVRQPPGGDDRLELDDLADVLEEPGIDGAEGEEVLRGHAAPVAFGHREAALGIGDADLLAQRLVVGGRPVHHQPPAVLLEGAHGLLQGLLEGAPDGHGFAHRLHLGGQGLVRLGKLLEGPARELDHAVVDGGLEGGGRLARDVVAELVEGVADGKLGRDLGDGEARGFRGQRRRAGHARVHLDHHHASVGWTDAELYVRPSRLHPDLADDGEGGVAHPLVFLVGEGLGGGDGDGVARVHAHRIEVLDRADDDHVVGEVAHHLELELFPADHRLLHEDLARRALLEAPLDRRFELLGIVGDGAARAPEGERGTDDDGEADPMRPRARDRFLIAPGEEALGHLEADAGHGRREQVSVLRRLDGG